jgi:GTP-binding protein EngB required for normal cell division
MRRPSRASLPERLDALAAAAEDAEGWLPGGPIAQARTVVERAGQRRRLSGEHTVVALAGSTGSGKSSLFNAVTRLEIARVGVRRPTTSEPLACVWGAHGAGELLDWLGIPPRHRVPKESLLDSAEADALDGLVLLDLPDHDSAVESHREQVDRLVEMVDLFVWVTDPQKYADAALHERYLQPMADHAAVTVVLLNQIDQLTPHDVKTCVADLERLLTEDGLPKIPILPLSAKTGEGIDEFFDLLRSAVSQRRASDDRVAADVSAAASKLFHAAGKGAASGVTDKARDQLVATLADAAGVDVVADAAGTSYRRRARAATGWPFTKWTGRLRPDPLRRFGVRKDRLAPDAVRMSLPKPSPVQRTRSDSAIRAFVDAAAAGGPRRWVSQVRSRAVSAGNQLPAVLDRSVASVSMEIGRRPWWWRFVGFWQQVLMLTALAGAGWLLAAAVVSWLQLPDIPVPHVGLAPVPTLLLLGGIAAGIVLSVICRFAARAGARRKSAIVRRKLHDAVAATADEVVVQPLTAELDRLESFRTAVSIAKG